ncbi:hypothetical protein PIB30_118924 [Stylosanthes scabra]|uniref:Uncharacterized protein n=1 Tax=Stylosanthes scabra TaxID=79078 RepID=A0ABU6R9J8_9FABA|nr:hypothetical protein [Stylosanthes scabra]
MSDASSMPTPMVSSPQLLSTGSEPFHDQKLYKSAVGTLQYITITRPDLSYAVSKVSQFMHSPLLSHWKAVKQILRYIQGTKDYGIVIHKCNDFRLYYFSDLDWAADIEDRRSVSGYCIFLGTNLLSWSCRKQPTVSRSSTEAEFRSMVECEAELVWIKGLLAELQIPLSKFPMIFCDNLSTVMLTHNTVFHNRTKHFQLDVQSIREKIQSHSLQVVHIPGTEQIADILTKPLILRVVDVCASWVIFSFNFS